MAALTAKELRDWLKPQVSSPSWTIGRLDSTKSQTICIYSGLTPQTAIHNVAGSKGTYKPVGFRVLIRWTNDFAASSEKAAEVYEVLAQRSRSIAGKMAYIFHRFSEPVNLGSADDGVFEQAVDITIITER